MRACPHQPNHQSSLQTKWVAFEDPGMCLTLSPLRLLICSQSVLSQGPQCASRHPPRCTDKGQDARSRPDPKAGHAAGAQEAVGRRAGDQRGFAGAGATCERLLAEGRGDVLADLGSLLPFPVSTASSAPNTARPRSRSGHTSVGTPTSDASRSSRNLLTRSRRVFAPLARAASTIGSAGRLSGRRQRTRR